MTRGAVSKRARLGVTSPVSKAATKPPNLHSHPSRSFTAPLQIINGGAGVSSHAGFVATESISSSRPPVPPLPHHLSASQQQHQPPAAPQDLHRSPSALSLNSNHPPARTHAARPAAPLTVNTTTQKLAPSGAVHGPSPSTNPPSATFAPPQPDQFHELNDVQQRSVPSSATQAKFPDQGAPNSTLPPLASPVSAPPPNSTSAPPFLAHPHPHAQQPPPPQADYYPARASYPGPHPPPYPPPGTPTSASFAGRQQSAPASAPGDPMIMDHGQTPHHPVYAHGPHAVEQGVNGSVHGQPHPAGPPSYQPVQPVDHYSAPPPNMAAPSYTGPAVPPPGYQYATAPAAAPQPTWSNSQKAGATKKHTRAHVACNACRNRKQKCDEMVPSCSYCAAEKIPCEYRQVQPPKADRNLATLQDSQLKLEGEVKSIRSDITDILHLLKSQHRMMSTGDGTSPRRHSAGLNSEQAEDNETVQEQAPGEHSTGAQHLSKKFPRTEPWFRAAGLENYASYPYELEQQKGTPRIFGIGWSGDDSTISGKECNKTYNNSFRTGSYTVKNKGGLNPNGSLRLDQTTVKKYHDSYMRNMWVIYPIFNAEELKQRILAFCAMYSPDDDIKPGTPPLNQFSAHSPHASTGLKRSFSEMQGEPDDPGHCGDPRRPVDQSLNNAVILLILAIGKLCEHDKYIMTEDNYGKSDPFPEDVGSQGSSPNYQRPSSTRSTNSSSSPKFPNNIMNNNQQNWQDVYVPPNAKNVYKLPGLAYYAEAASILGQNVGRRGLEAAHAYILAGLYWGQLGHVLQSADWIHMAANAVVELSYSFPSEDIVARTDIEQVHAFTERPLAERNSINSYQIAFWTVQQMEGDILAELERLPTSRLGGHLQIDGKSMGMPHDLVGVTDGTSHALFSGSIDTTYILHHFLNQLMLRKYLNRAHLSLYGTQEQQREAASGRSKTLTWADLQPYELWQTVQNWREALPPALQWLDSEQPPSDILQARLRAKYYGFVYIVSRKVLENVAQSTLKLDPIEFKNVQNATLDELRGESMQSVAVGCKRCILSAMASTVAFDNTCDNTRKRAMLPNIMGTFTAQFSNMLVLSYCVLDPRVRGLVPSGEAIVKLLQRTIRLLHNLSPLSPVFKVNRDILLKAYEDVSAELGRAGIKVEPAVVDSQRNHSLVVGGSWPTPPNNYGSPGVQSTGRSSQGPGTPRHDHITSANASFNVPR